MKIFILVDGAQQGPYTHEQLQQMQLTPDTYVWYKGLPEWKRAGECEETAYLFGNTGAACDPQQAQGAAQAPQQPQGFAPADQQYQGQPQQYQAPQYQEPAEGYNQEPAEYDMPSQYIVLAIIALVCCCPPCGVIALVFGSRVPLNWRLGDYERARKDSNIAKWCAIGGIIAGVVFYTLYIVFAAAWARAMGNLIGSGSYM